MSQYFSKPTVPADVVWTYAGVRPLYKENRSVNIAHRCWQQEQAALARPAAALLENANAGQAECTNMDGNRVSIPMGMKKIIVEIYEDLGAIPGSYLGISDDMSGHHFRDICEIVSGAGNVRAFSPDD